MIKIVFFTILLAMLGPVKAGSSLSHERFVHLSYEEQKQIVIGMMELIVEIEARYKHDVKTSGYDSERFRRYSEFMRRVSNLLLPEAAAQTAIYTRYGQYLSDLRSITSPPPVNRNSCLYAGWMSEMVGDKCTHPSASPRFRNKYATEVGCTFGRNTITCNPAIFGFKNVRQKTLFCVEAGEKNSDNSSRDCMVKSLELQLPREPGASSKEERLRDMVFGIAANPKDSEAVFDFLIKACACDPQKTPQVSRKYAEYMRPHQTCFGLLKMLSEVAPKCLATSQPLDANEKDFLSKIQNLLTVNQIKMNEKPNDGGQNVRTIYKNAIEPLIANDPSVAAICGTSPTTPNECPEGRRKEPSGCCLEDEAWDKDSKTCMKVHILPEVVVTATRLCPDGTEPPCKQPTTVPTEPIPTDVTPQLVCPDERKKEDGSCCPENQVTAEDKKSCRDKPAECPENRRYGTNQCCESPKIADAEKKACIDPPSNGVSLTLSSSIKDANTVTVTATLSTGAKREDYRILWFHRGGSAITSSMTFSGQSPEAPRTPSGPNLRPDADSPPVAATSTPESEKLSTGDTKINRSGDDNTMDAPRTAREYEVCARLIKKSDNTKASESCTKIKPKDPVTPAGPGFQNPFMQQPMPTRGGASDAIFRGVR